MTTFATTDPRTGETVATYPSPDAAALEAQLVEIQAGGRALAALRSDQRADLLDALADELDRIRPELAHTITLEMGKPLAESEAEVTKSAACCRHYARRAPELLAARDVVTEADTTVVPRPLGSLLAIMPWNFPVWQVLRASVPSLLLGNSVAVKPAPNVPGSALAVEAAAQAAGYPPGSLRSLFVDDATTGELIADPRISAVALTGSERAGRAVGGRAGECLKKVVLELGGSDPALVLSDADLDRTAAEIVSGRLANAGQACISPKRVLVAAGVADAFADAIVARVDQVRCGDPFDRDVDLGPLAREDIRAGVAAQVDATKAAGAAVLRRGGATGERGWGYEPTVLAAVVPGQRVFDEEVFGPVLALTVGRDDDELVELANTTRYGLGASVWSEDGERAEGIADRLDAGMVFVNDNVRSDPRLPFGGVKSSGLGRELGDAGLSEVANLQTRWTRRSVAAEQR